MRKTNYLLCNIYIAAENGSKITYRSLIDEGQRAQASIKRKHQHKIIDNKASYGPPDKSEHFAVSDDDDFDAATSLLLGRKLKFYIQIMMVFGIEGGLVITTLRLVYKWVERTNAFL